MSSSKDELLPLLLQPSTPHTPASKSWAQWSPPANTALPQGCPRADAKQASWVSRAQSSTLCGQTLPSPFTLLILGESSLESILTLQSGSNPHLPAALLRKNFCNRMRVITWGDQARECRRTTDTCHAILLIPSFTHRKPFLLSFFFPSSK